ncbi:flagellar basal body L-ring protein FlgH [Kiloniella laminariae]|uniref:Flagellar L-ring protein n=1 Tax=Kiloniella laminariae TaxID=454162 RepID=A0ABT4LHB1_9PROT|nr:flagellar basal body L-ring protein FlgH [Kiloniella laminariae]MCZ4280495.1 flagellar basal body L-ring protein FlgH [Kiloniella laminariae]
MSHLFKATLGKGAVAVLIGLSLTACNALSRISQIGEEPKLSKIENPAPPQPISLPMPAPQVAERQPNSLWRPGSRAFLKDQRADQIGDLLTVVIQIADEAKVSNTTERTRASAEGAGLSSFLGYETELGRVFNDNLNPASLVDADSSSSSKGVGSVDRNESIKLRVAALVTQVMPNGNLIISGRQEVRVNYEVRELLVSGMIRPEDITSTNTISYDQIAEARIAYGGRGQLSDVQQPRYGQQLYDIIFPF